MSPTSPGGVLRLWSEQPARYVEPDWPYLVSILSLTKDHISKFPRERCLFAVMILSQKIKYTGIAGALEVREKESWLSELFTLTAPVQSRPTPRAVLLSLASSSQ